MLTEDSKWVTLPQEHSQYACVQKRVCYVAVQLLMCVQALFSESYRWMIIIASSSARLPSR